MIDHNEAEKILGSTDVERSKAKGRAEALAGENTEKPKERSTEKPRKNVVEREMKLDQYHRSVFARVHDAVSAAERACQKAKDTVQSEKEMDAALEATLNDLQRVIGDIRDERKEIVRESSSKSGLLYMS